MKKCSKYLIMFYLPTICLMNCIICFSTRFTPDAIKLNIMNYENDPIYYNENILNLKRNTTYNLSPSLIHDGNPLGRDVVVGLALYQNFLNGFKRLVGSLRYFGYDGHIILGVRHSIGLHELNYLKMMNVTLYGIQNCECDEIAFSKVDKSLIRGKCSTDITNLKLEWGRFEMARRWIEDCEKCTGWNLLLDTRDTFFQDHPVSISINLPIYIHTLIICKHICYITCSSEI